MIKIGKLAKYKTDDEVLAQIMSTYNKADIDPDCPESVAIIGMVRIMYLSGPQQGRESSVRTKNFYHFWEVIND